MATNKYIDSRAGVDMVVSMEKHEYLSILYDALEARAVTPEKITDSHYRVQFRNMNFGVYYGFVRLNGAGLGGARPDSAKLMFRIYELCEEYCTLESEELESSALELRKLTEDQNEQQDGA